MEHCMRKVVSAGDDGQEEREGLRHWSEEQELT